ncbi:hypothetical protein [Microbacterium sp. CJ77]|uniref:hypothetical protein n=1 Tax=Microbacterium sp. CJ77 TaxID=2079201 RepID=UPI000CD85BF7|nr:hypothetical protein [Microbacterium sp. CJ77]
MLTHQPDSALTQGRIDLLRHDIHPSNSKGCGIKPGALQYDLFATDDAVTPADHNDAELRLIDPTTLDTYWPGPDPTPETSLDGWLLPDTRDLTEEL